MHARKQAPGFTVAAGALLATAATVNAMTSFHQSILAHQTGWCMMHRSAKSQSRRLPNRSLHLSSPIPPSLSDRC